MLFPVFKSIFGNFDCMMKSWSLPLLLGIVLFVSFYRLGSVSLFDVDEAVFAEATKEMVESGDWITPTYNGANRYDKPILFYWMMAGSYYLFGINEFGARFPSAFCGVILSLAVFFFTKRFSNEKTALYAATALVLSPYYFMYSHAAVTDMALTAFITLSLFSLFIFEKEADNKRSDRYLNGFYLFSALAFLTKGLIGVIFPLCIGAAYLISSGGLRNMKRIFTLKGTVLFLVVALPWYAAEFAINGKDFFQQFFIKHHFMRYTGVISGHKGPFYYYIPALVAGLFPWIAFMPAGTLREANEKDQPDRGNSVRLLASIWLGLIVLFFSFSTTKLPNYILPAIPAACVLIGSGMSGQFSGWRRYSHLCIAGFSAVFTAGFAISGRYLLKEGISDTGWTFWAAGVMFLMMGVCVHAFFTRGKSYGSIAALMVGFLVLICLKVLPMVNQQLQGTLYNFSLSARERLGAEGNLIGFGINNPSVVFYSGHNIKNVDRLEDIRGFLSERKKIVVIARSKDLEFLEPLGLKLVGKNGKYAFLENK